MAYGYAGMAVCHLAMFTCLLMGSPYVPFIEMSPPVGFLTLIFAMTAVATFAVCLSTPSMLYTTEIVPPMFRTLIIPLAVGVGWLLHFLLALTVPMFFSFMGPFLFFLFSAVCVALFTLGHTYIETKKVSEEDLASLAMKPLGPLLSILCGNPRYEEQPGLECLDPWYSSWGTREIDSRASTVSLGSDNYSRRPAEHRLTLGELEEEDARTLVTMPRTARTRRLLSHGIMVPDGEMWIPLQNSNADLPEDALKFEMPLTMPTGGQSSAESESHVQITQLQLPSQERFVEERYVKKPQSPLPPPPYETMAQTTGAVVGSQTQPQTRIPSDKSKGINNTNSSASDNQSPNI